MQDVITLVLASHHSIPPSTYQYMSLQFELGAKKVVLAFTPNKTLGEGLAEFCKPLGLEAAQHALRRGKQVFNLIFFDILSSFGLVRLLTVPRSPSPPRPILPFSFFG